MEMSNRNPATLARYSLPDWKCCWNVQSAIIVINPQYHGGQSTVTLSVLIPRDKVKCNYDVNGV